MKITYALLYHVPKSRYFSFLEAKVSTKSSYTWRSILKTKNGKINDFTYLQCTYVHSELIVEETRWWEMDLMEAIFLPHEVGFIPKNPHFLLKNWYGWETILVRSRQEVLVRLLKHGERFDKPSMSRVGNSIDEVVSWKKSFWKWNVN